MFSQRKFNGCCVFGKTQDFLASRRTSKITGKKIPYMGKFPHILDEMRSLCFPDNSVLVGEMVWFDEKGRDNFRMLQRMTGSGDAYSLELQKEFGSPDWILYELLFLNSKPAYLLPYRKRHEIIETAVTKANTQYIKVIQNLPGTIEENYARVLREGWEGLVLKDPEGISEVVLDDINNNSPRPNIAWKLVPQRIAEAIVCGFEYGSGANKNRVGHIYLEMLNSKGERVPVGKVGIFEGYTQDVRDELAARKHFFNGKYYEFEVPFVAKVAYSSWTDKKHLFHPKVVAFTEEKGIEECRLEEELENE